VRYSPRKVPLTTAGRAASSTDPATWTSYRKVGESKVGCGVGFVLNGDGIACIDLDHCLAGGRLAPWARRILEMLPATYVEVSPSGDGLHVWGLGRLDRGRKVKVDSGSVELYGTDRYITVTGRRFEDSPSRLGDISGVLAALT